MSIKEYLGIGTGDQQQQTCEWCGKEGVSVWWSGSKANYCSFRCSAAGSYHKNIILAACMIALETILVLIQIMMFLRYPILTSAYVIIIVPQVIITLIVLSIIYSVYVGRSMRKERADEQKKSGGPDAMYSS